MQKLFTATLTKVDEAKKEVWGIATQEVPDCSGEIFHYETSKPFFQQWSDHASKITQGKSLGNLRYMHQLDVAGKLIALEFNDETKSINIGTKITDDQVWKEVVEGALAGFSIGGSYVKTWKDKNSDLLYFTAKPSEISIVDLPCCPAAVIEVVKADGSIDHLSLSNNSLGKKKDGILFHYGIKDGKSEVQSVLFDKEKWTKEEAKAWCKENDYSTSSMDESDSYYHFTQHDPGKYDSIRTGKPGDKSVEVVMTKPKPPAVKAIDSRLENITRKYSQPESVKSAVELFSSIVKSSQVQIAKSMYDVADLACLLVQIRNIQSCQRWEADMEGGDEENYAIANKLGEWLATGVDILKEVVEEETSELTAA